MKNGIPYLIVDTSVWLASYLPNRPGHDSALAFFTVATNRGGHARWSRPASDVRQGNAFQEHCAHGDAQGRNCLAGGTLRPDWNSISGTCASVANCMLAFPLKKRQFFERV